MRQSNLQNTSISDHFKMINKYDAQIIKETLPSGFVNATPYMQIPMWYELDEFTETVPFGSVLLTHYHPKRELFKEEWTLKHEQAPKKQSLHTKKRDIGYIYVGDEMAGIAKTNIETSPIPIDVYSESIVDTKNKILTLTNDETLDFFLNNEIETFSWLEIAYISRKLLRVAAYQNFFEYFKKEFPALVTQPHIQISPTPYINYMELRFMQ